MEILRLATAAVIAIKPLLDRRLLIDGLGLPLIRALDSPYDYWSSEAILGVAHFGVWPLSEAAAAELAAGGHELLHGPRTEPWGQVVARLQAPGGVIIGVCTMPAAD